MKTRQLTLLVLFFSCCMAIFACRKEFNNIIQGRELVSSNLLEDAKVWYLQHLNLQSSPKLPPDWRGGWIIERSSGKMLIVPAPEKYIENTDFSIRRFFLFRIQSSKVSNGRIVELVGEEYDVEKNLDFLLENYDKNAITDFNGSILQYDINYSPLENTTL